VQRRVDLLEIGAAAADHALGLLGVVAVEPDLELIERVLHGVVIQNRNRRRIRPFARSGQQR
jgi:hypothetical protein